MNLWSWEAIWGKEEEEEGIGVQEQVVEGWWMWGYEIHTSVFALEVEGEKLYTHKMLVKI